MAGNGHCKRRLVKGKPRACTIFGACLSGYNRPH